MTETSSCYTCVFLRGRTAEHGAGKKSIVQMLKPPGCAAWLLVLGHLPSLCIYKIGLIVIIVPTSEDCCKGQINQYGQSIWNCACRRESILLKLAIISFSCAFCQLVNFQRVYSRSKGRVDGKLDQMRVVNSVSPFYSSPSCPRDPRMICFVRL